VDEYQDTNPLQEQIYFTIIQQTGASFTIEPIGRDFFVTLSGRPSA